MTLPPRKAQKLISEVLRAHPAVLDAPEPLVLVEELGAATVNLRVNYWFDSGTHSPAKINSALLRQTKNVLLESGIELPDPAREVVFPRGVHVTMLSGTAEPSTPSTLRVDQARRSVSWRTSSDTTEGEGNLSSETKVISQQAEGIAPEGKENLLKS